MKQVAVSQAPSTCLKEADLADPFSAPFPVINISKNGVHYIIAAQRAAFKQFIRQDKYLSDRRGNYTEKYGGETPWFSQVDLRILQDFIILGTKNNRTLQLSLDFVNISNLFNSHWGVRKYATTAGYYQPLSVTYNNNVPAYQFDPSLQSTFITSPDLPSRWQCRPDFATFFDRNGTSLIRSTTYIY